MTMTDPIGDLLTRIRNGYQAKRKIVESPYSRVKESISRILAKEGYLKQVSVEGKEPQEKKLVLALKYEKKESVITGIERISKPGVRIYAKEKKIPRVLWGKGIVILFTSQGVMTDKEARRRKVGGEIVCQVW